MKRKKQWIPVGVALTLLTVAGFYAMLKPYGGFVLGPKQKVSIKAGKDRWIGDGWLTSRNPQKPDAWKLGDSGRQIIDTIEPFDEVYIDNIHAGNLALATFNKSGAPYLQTAEAGYAMLRKTDKGWETLMRFPYMSSPVGFFKDGERVLCSEDVQFSYGVYSTKTGDLLEKIRLGRNRITVPGKWPYLFHHHHDSVTKVDAVKAARVDSWKYDHHGISDMPTHSIHFGKDAVLVTTTALAQRSLLETLLIKVGLRKDSSQHRPEVYLATSTGGYYFLASLPETTKRIPVEARWIGDGPSIAVRYENDWFVFDVQDNIWRTLKDR